MDAGHYPGKDGDEMENGYSIINDYKTDESETTPHTPLSEPVKHEASIYAISQAFQTGLPGINSNRR
jgi:hypothetical protein